MNDIRRDKSILYLPVVAPHDFQRFREILKQEICDTYEEWSVLHGDRIAMYSTEFVIREVKVAPDKFLDFCRLKNLPYDRKSMLIIAEHFGKQRE